MGAYSYIRESFQRALANRTPELRARLAAWRKENVVERAERPTNPVAAHRLGYKARPDFIVARVRVKRGRRARPKYRQGRKPAKTRKFVEPGPGWRWIAEQKAAKRFRNLEVIGSYFAGEDGTARYFEVVLQNPNWPSKPRLKPAAAPAVR